MPDVSTDLSQRVVNAVVKVSLPVALGFGAWLFGTVQGLTTRMTVVETERPILRQQLDRIEKKLDRFLEKEDLARKP